jgi:hypothetical protein
MDGVAKLLSSVVVLITFVVVAFMPVSLTGRKVGHVRHPLFFPITAMVNRA